MKPTSVGAVRRLRVAFNRQCARCQTKNLRFIHVLEHKDGHQIHVGIECAGVLIRNFELPRLAENETKRKAEWREQKYKTPGRCFTTPEQLVERGKLSASLTASTRSGYSARMGLPSAISTIGTPRSVRWRMSLSTRPLISR